MQALDGALRARSHQEMKTLASSSSTLEGGDGRFIWNGRKCKGTALHLAALVGDVESLLQLFEKGHMPDEQFDYVSFFKNEPQEGRGEAIHLAASRGKLEAVQVLVEKGARIDAKVLRAGVDHYDVLHAAVFAEGRGGDPATVQYLLEAGADRTCMNSDGKSVLHLAFQTGNLPMIKMFIDMEDSTADGKTTPLELGIQVGKMSWKDLADSARVDVKSLKSFINNEPEVIPFFLERIQGLKPEIPAHPNEQAAAEGSYGDEVLATMASHLTCDDLAKLIKGSPKAAMALLFAVNVKPAQECEGWHPLPARVSFQSTGWTELLYSKLNPTKKTRISFYETDVEWTYDAEKFKAPEWHAKLTDRKERPFSESDIRVCLVPDIISVSIFSALGDVPDEAGFLLDHPLLQSMITFNYWNGPCQVDMVQFGFNFWVLLTIMVENALAPKDSHAKYVSSFALQDGTATVAGNLVFVKGVLVLVHEVIQLLGCISIGKPWSYFSADNLWDTLYWLLPLVMQWWSYNQVLSSLLILTYWSQIIAGVSYMEVLAEAVLPIRKLARRLVPAFLVTVLAAVAFGHALYQLDHAIDGKLFSNASDDDRFFYQIFSMLITHTVNGPPRRDWRSIFAVYSSVIVFAVFFMNVFLGVSMEGYSIEKRRWRQSLGRIRVNSSFAFLSRTQIIPTDVLDRLQTKILFCITVLLAIAFQVVATKLLCHRKDAWIYLIPVVFLMLHGTLQFCAYQNLTNMNPLKKGGARYLWTCMPRDNEAEEEEAEKVVDLKAEIGYLRGRLSELEDTPQMTNLNMSMGLPSRSERKSKTNIKWASSQGSTSSGDSHNSARCTDNSVPERDKTSGGGSGLPTLLAKKQVPTESRQNKEAPTSLQSPDVEMGLGGTGQTV